MATSAALVVGIACAPRREAPVLVPGDTRLDARWLRPYTRTYAIHYVPSSATAEFTERVAGTLTERIQLGVVGGDSVILRIWQADYPGHSTETDTLTLERTTLAPIRWRTYGTRDNYRGGIDFDGTRVAHFGAIPEEAVDTNLAHGAFLSGSEVLVIPTLLFSSGVRLPARVSMLKYVQTDWSFWAYDVFVQLPAAPRLAEGRTEQGVWQVGFGGARYWVEKGSYRIIQWDDPPGEGGFFVRYIMVGPR